MRQSTFLISAYRLRDLNGAGRNIFVAPHYWDLDLGLIKTLAVTEKWKLQFRMEMFMP